MIKIIICIEISQNYIYTGHFGKLIRVLFHVFIVFSNWSLNSKIPGNDEAREPIMHTLY